MSQYPAVIELSSLDGNNGFQINGEGANDHSGRSVSSAGDVNGDGFADVIVAAPFNDTSYVIFGKASGFGASFNLSSLNGTNGFRMDGGNFANAVSSAGDVNGDGFDDVIVGDQNAGSGASYVVFGKASGFGATLALSSLDGTNGFRINGEVFYDLAGRAVSSAGDVNGDGFDDILIGAPWADPVGNKSGTAYVVFGKASGFAATLSLANLDGNNGFEIRSEAAGDETGWSVSSAGDVNGDGFDDLLVGAIGASLNGSPAGASYVVFGKASGIGALFMLSQLDGTNGFQINSAALGDQTGVSVSSAGDVNSDGFADVIVGARSADPHGGSSGSSYVVFGKASGFGATLELSGLDGTNGFRINGEATKDYSGWSVSSAGDVNGDGFDDVIVGAYGADPNGALSGASYVVFGKASGFAATLDLSSLDGMNGFKINGAAADDRSGYSVSAAGDMNGDGFDDLLVAAPYADPYGALSGTTYVIFGSMPGEAVTRTGTDIANTIHGGDFRDTLAGLKGDDTLYGHRRSDDLNGGRGNDTLIGGMSDDDIRGGAGADTFVYESALESTSKHYDTISNANFAVGDRFDVFVAVVAIDAEIVTGKLWKGNFDADLSAAADTAHLGAGHAVLFTPDHGNLAGETFLIVDQNGTAGYQAGEDLVINLLQPVNAGALGIEDFI